MEILVHQPQGKDEEGPGDDDSLIPLPEDDARNAISTNVPARLMSQPA